MDNSLHNLPKLPKEIKMYNIPRSLKDIESVLENYSLAPK